MVIQNLSFVSSDKDEKTHGVGHENIPPMVRPADSTTHSSNGDQLGEMSVLNPGIECLNMEKI